MYRVGIWWPGFEKVFILLWWWTWSFSVWVAMISSVWMHRVWSQALMPMLLDPLAANWFFIQVLGRPFRMSQSRPLIRILSKPPNRCQRKPLFRFLRRSSIRYQSNPKILWCQISEEKFRGNRCTAKRKLSPDYIKNMNLEIWEENFNSEIRGLRCRDVW